MSDIFRVNIPGGPASDRERIVSRERSEEVSLEDELVTALDSAGVEFEDRDKPLVKFIDPSGLASLRWENESLTVHTRAWEYPISLTPDRIVVWEPAPVDRD